MKKAYKKPVIEVGTVLGDDMICEQISTSGEYGGGTILSKDRDYYRRGDNEDTNGKLWDTKW